MFPSGVFKAFVPSARPPASAQPKPNRIWTQCVKELAQFRRDRLTVALVLILPMVTLLLFGFAIRLETKDIPLVVQDLDHSPLSRAYMERLYATKQFQPIKAEDARAIDRNQAKAAVIIPPDFARRIKARKPSPVQVVIDGTDGNNARVIQNSIRATNDFFLRSNGLQSTPRRVVAHTRLWFNPGRQESLYIVPGVYAVTLWIFPSLITAIAMAREKEYGTLVQVYASSLSATELLLGKGLAYLFIGLVQALIVLGSGSFLFHLGFAGDPTPLLLGTPIFLSTSVLFGLFVGARANSQSAAVQGTATTGFLTAYLLSGFIYPISNIPFPLSLISFIVPARYYIDLTRDAFVRGAGWSSVWYAPLVLVLLSLLLFRGAERTLHRMQLPEGSITKPPAARGSSKISWFDRLLKGRFWSLVKKEADQTLANRQLVFLLLFPPTIQLIVFGLALNPEVKHLKLGIVDASNTLASRELVHAFTVNDLFEAHYTLREKTLSDQVHRGQLNAGLIIPPEFNRNLDRGTPADIQILIDAVDANTAGIAAGYAAQIVGQYNRQLDPNQTPPLVDPQVTILYNPGLISSWFFVPGVLGLILTLMSSLVSAAALVREKETGTLEQLLMTPAADWEILLAKVVPLYLLLLGDMLLALGIARLVFGVPFRGSLGLLLFLASLAIFVGIGIGTLLATLSGSQIQTQLLAFFINLPVNILSGTVTPIESMPPFFRYLSFFNPLRHYVEIVRGILLKGVGLEVLWPNALALGVFAMILLTVSANRFRSQLS
jgi:ABC-2 type transport system permease protein